jgi:YD repeat-containing protein
VAGSIHARGAILDIFMQASVGSKDFIFNGAGELTKVQVFIDSDLTELVFTKDFSYNGVGQLITVTLTREGDGSQWLKSLTYDADGNLIDVTVDPVL